MVGVASIGRPTVAQRFSDRARLFECKIYVIASMRLTWTEGRRSGRQIEWRNEQAFGKPIWPHLFRDCAVTELVDSARKGIGIAPDLVGHSDLQTTRKHYIQARGMSAHARVQDMIAGRRRVAARGKLDA